MTPKTHLLHLLSGSLILLVGVSPTLFAQGQQFTKQGSSPQAAPVASITVSPAFINVGQKTLVAWKSQHARSVLINGHTVRRSGSYMFSPGATTALTLTATGAGGETTAQAQVTVLTAAAPPSPPPPAPPTPPTPPTPPAPPTPPPSNPVGSNSPLAPHINYTDLNVGSGTGGDDGNGVYVRIFGTHFGSSQGTSTVTLGGQLITGCPLCSWNDTQIIAKLGSAASTGNIVVAVGSLSSNGAPFTVTPTNIVFVSPNGSDNNSGTYAAPFRTWRAAFNSVTSNDNNAVSQNTVIYLEPGVTASVDDGRGYRASVSTDLGGTSPVAQLAIVGFPGGTANIGSTSVDNGVHGWGKYLTIANLSIMGGSSAIDDEAGNVRIINNDLSCPAPAVGLGDTACILGETDNPSDTWVFQGNNVHDTGGRVDKTYHAVYFSTNVNHADVGWNAIGLNFKGYCRSLMFHASAGGNLFDLHVHDNLITGGYCDAIGFASVDPSQGVVEAYNNVIAHVAIASSPYGVANETGIAINSDPAGSTSGTVQVYNNTVVDAGSYTLGNQNGCFGVVSSGAGLNLTNNICVQPGNSQPYIQSQSQGVTGSHNLWFGAGGAPSSDSSPVTAAPNFASTTTFTLQSTSPAYQGGTAAKSSVYDLFGTLRPNPPSIGAVE